MKIYTEGCWNGRSADYKCHYFRLTDAKGRRITCTGYHNGDGWSRALAREVLDELERDHGLSRRTIRFHHY